MEASAVDEWTEPHWGRSALLVIDVQVDFVDGGAMPVAGTAAVVPALRRLVDVYRAAGRPVVHVVRLYDGDDVDPVRRGAIAGGAQVVRPGTPGSQLIPELAPAGAGELDVDRLLAGQDQELGPREVVLWKPRWSAFYRTSLEALLRRWGVDTVVVAGCNFPNCPRASLVDALSRDLRSVVVTDAVSRTTDVGIAEVVGMGVVVATTNEVVDAVGGLSPEPAAGVPLDEAQADAIQRFWQRARLAAGLGRLDVFIGPGVGASVPPPVWSFGDSQEQADNLVGLVLAGHKTGTATALPELTDTGDPLPRVGELSILLDGAGRPRALVRTTSVDVVPFDEVGAEFAASEGEDDGSLASWREGHGRYFGRVLGEGRFSASTPIVCERFELLHPVPPRVRWR
jgi:uncharacterized protein YhfF/nicotinamidase-related amidase